MITTKDDLLYYLQEDKKALNIKKKKPRLIYENPVWVFQIILRKHEYYHNLQRKNIFQKLVCKYYAFRHNRLGLKLGFSIPVNVFGYGLRINHYGLIVVNPNCKIGNYCDIHQGVNIGQGNSKDDIPIIGNNVFIAPGAKIFGKIIIKDKTAIGANSVVNKSFDKEDITIAGIPAKVIKETGTSKMNVSGNFITS